jgi:hypothetical protein
MKPKIKQTKTKLIESFIAKNTKEIDDYLIKHSISTVQIISIIHLHEDPSFDHYEVFFNKQASLLIRIFDRICRLLLPVPAVYTGRKTEPK